MAWTPAPNQPDRIHVWSSQLAANDFPPVCAMTGAPSETWRKFRFARGEPLGFFWADPFGGLVWGAIRDHASGRLPLTRRSSRTVGLARWIPWGLIVGTVVLWTVGAVLDLGSDPTNQVSSTAWLIFFAIGCLSVMFGLVGFLVSPLMRPRGRLLKERRGQEDVVELCNLHHGFVQAANQMYAERAAAAGTPENLPLSPASN